MKADIYIPTANNIQALTECLDSLANQTYKRFAIILVGIRKNEKIEQLTKKYPHLQINYIIQRNPGLVEAAIEALQQSTGDIFIRIDDDVVTKPDWLAQIVTIFKQNPDIGGVTGPTLTSTEGRNSRDLFLFFEKTQKSKNPFWKIVNSVYTGYIYENRLHDIGHFLRSGAFTLGSNFENSLHLPEPIDVDNLEACNMAMRTKLLKDIGGFDLIFNRGLGEYHEADIAYKIKKAGYQVIFSSRVRLQHKVETTETASKPRADAFHRIANFIIFYRRHIGFRNLDYFARFMTNVTLQNSYYIYKALTTKDVSQLGALPGTLYGLCKRI